MAIPHFLSEKEEFQQLTHMMLLRIGKSNPIGVILFQATEKWQSFSRFINLPKISLIVLRETFQFLLENIEVRLNELQYRKLYNMTDLFHSTMDIDLILENVLVTDYKKIFQISMLSLFYRMTKTVKHEYDIKPFDYLSERPSTIEAFVSGEITTEYADRFKLSFIKCAY